MWQSFFGAGFSFGLETYGDGEKTVSIYLVKKGQNIDESGNVTLSTIKTYDLVGTPGFSQAKLSLKENQQFESLNESAEDGNIMFAIVEKDEFGFDEDEKKKKEDEKKDSSEDLLGGDDKDKKDDDSSDEKKDEKEDESKEDEPKEDDKKEDEGSDEDDNKNSSKLKFDPKNINYIIKSSSLNIQYN